MSRANGINNDCFVRLFGAVSLPTLTAPIQPITEIHNNNIR